MEICASSGGIYTMVGIAGYLAGALIVVGVFVAQRIRRASKLAELDGGDVSTEREDS
jgi:hypothetical protein